MFPIKSKNLASPWITKGIIKSSKKKQKLYEKFLKRKTCINENNYKNYKRLFENVKNRSKKNYFSERLITYKNNVKKTWNVIKEVIGSTKSSKHSLPKRIVVNKIEILNNKKIADTFNKHFASVGPNLANSIPKASKGFETFLYGNHSILNEYPLTDDELKNAFLTLKTKTSPGFDEINPDVVKHISDAIFSPIKSIFNSSLITGNFPNKLKIARVSPIFKNDEEELVENYRPISVLPCFSKILERIMFNRLYSFLQVNNTLYKKQFGFQKEHSTEHAILQLTNQIQQSFQENLLTIGVFIDLSKAFDTVDHKILLKKLSFYGIRNKNLKWFESYLSGRKQFISSEQGNTDMEDITFGVPQGSILGPLLFLIFVNDLNNSTSLDPIMFADDTNLFYSHKNIETLFETVNKELININIWFQANKLSLNTKKTKFVLFHKPRTKVKLPLSLPVLKINNVTIERVKALKFLGVIIDENITWKHHIGVIENKISKNIGILFKASKYLNFRCLANIYFALIHSYINYANIVWASSNRTGLKKIFQKQKQAMRIIFNKPYFSHSKPLMKNLKSLNVYQINLYQIILFMYKVKMGTVPQIFNSNFSSADHCHNTRFSLNCFQLPRSSKVSKFSIIIRGPTLWNKFLTDNEKNNSSFPSFKQILKNKLLNFDNELTFF